MICLPLPLHPKLWGLPLEFKMTCIRVKALDSHVRWNLICRSLANGKIYRKSRIQQLCQHCFVNTWAVRHLGVLVTAVTHHCLMKLETQRNTNLDIAGYLYDIGHVKLTVAVCICKHLPVCIPNNGFFVEVPHAPRLRQRSSRDCKFLSFLQYYLIIQICIYSLSAVTVESQAYALIIASLPGHRQGKRTLGIIHCVSEAVGAQWIGRLVDEGTGHTVFFPKHLHLHLQSLWLPPSAFLPLRWTILLPSLLNVKGCEKESLFFSSLRRPLKTQQHLIIIILPLLLPKASLAGNLYPTFAQVMSPYSGGLMAKKEEILSRREGK